MPHALITLAMVSKRGLVCGRNRGIINNTTHTKIPPPKKTKVAVEGGLSLATQDEIKQLIQDRSAPRPNLYRQARYSAARDVFLYRKHSCAGSSPMLLPHRQATSR